MKAIFIAYSQAYNEEITDILGFYGQRGYTRWTDIGGQGSEDGTPHLGTHAWPEMNHAVLTFVKDDSKAAEIISALRKYDCEFPDLGLRAFSWSVDEV